MKERERERARVQRNAGASLTTDENGMETRIRENGFTKTETFQKKLSKVQF